MLSHTYTCIHSPPNHPPPQSFLNIVAMCVCVFVYMCHIYYIIYNKVYHLNYFQVCSPLALSIFTVRQPSPPSVPRTFQHPKQKPSPLKTNSPLPASLPPAPGHHYFIYCLCKSDSSRYLLQVESYSTCPFCLASFTQHNILKVQPRGSMQWDAFPFMSEQYSHRMDGSPLVYPFIHQWTLGLLPALGYCEWCCYKHWCANTYLRPKFQLFWVSSIKHQEVRLPSIVILCLVF